MKIKLPLIAVAVLSTVSVSSHAALAYKLTDLGSLPGERSFSQAYSISNNGQISGRSRGSLPVAGGDDISGPTNAVRFHSNGYIQTLGTLGGGEGGHSLSSDGRAINNDGVVAGYSTTNTTDGSRVYNAFVNDFKKGRMHNIGTLGNGLEARAYGINNNGKVVGWSNTKADGTDHVGFIYDIETDTMTGMGGSILGGKRSFAFDINDQDQVAGTATLADGSAHAFSYVGGTATDLGSLDNSGYSEARAINENGFVTGWSLTESKDNHAFLYNGSEMLDLGSLGGDTKGLDVNIHGQVVGSGTDADGNNISFLYSDGQIINLVDLLSAEDQGMIKEFREAASINDDGTIVGRASFWTDKANDESQTRAFKIMADAGTLPASVPLPGAIFLMGPAVAFLGFMGKNRRSQAQAV